MSEQQPNPETENAVKHVRKTRTGVVVSNKMTKTLVVEHVARVPHPTFNKIVKRSKKYYVHDENSEAQVGDKVRIVETRPLSKTKRWTLEKVLSH